MEVTLILEKDELGTDWYKVLVDDNYIALTLTKNFAEAVENYNRVCENIKNPSERKVLLSTKVEEETTRSILDKLFPSLNPNL